MDRTAYPIARLVGLALWWLAVAVAAVIVDTVLGAAPLWVMILAVLILGGAAIPLMFWREIQEWRNARRSGAQPSPRAGIRRKESPPDVAVQEFDLPIRDAIRHLGQTIPHSYRDSASADRHFFGLLHSQMCDGELSVIGRKDESGALEEIGALECKLLKPIEAVVPKNPATPLGVRFSLFDLHADPPIEYSDLRVRKRDFFGIWTK